MKQRAASTEELDFLHSTGAIKVRAQNTIICSLSLLGFALSKTSGRGHLVSSLLELGRAEASTSANPCPPPAPVPPPMPPPQSATLPMVLPECTIDLSKFPKHYSLSNKLQGSHPLFTDMMEFENWLVSPVQMNRNSGKSASRTVQNIFNNVHLYLGFLSLHFGLTELSLSLFLDLDKYSTYISFQIAKQNSRINITQQLSNARKVLAFLKRNATAKMALSISEVEVWLSKLGKQVSRLLPEKKLDVGEMEEEGTWLPACDVVKLLDSLRLMALEEVTKYEGQLSDFAARLLHDAALSSCMFGFIPPPRLSCLRTLQVPSHVGCLHQDCVGSVNHKNCGGNRLERKGEDLLMVLPHHKNQVRWVNSEIKFKLPAELQSLLELFIEKGHSVVSPGSKYMFSDQKGRVMEEASQMSHWWESLLKRLGSPAIFPPTR